MIRIATVFSGIGAIEYALKKLKKEHHIVFACDNGERILEKNSIDIVNEIKNMSSVDAQDYIKELYLATGKPNFVKESYFANYDIDEKQWYDDKIGRASCRERV